MAIKKSLEMVALPLKTEKFSSFLKPGSTLLHSVMVDEKGRVTQKLCIWK